MSAVLNNTCALLAGWWGGGSRDYGWFVAPTNAANIIYGGNPPYQISDFLAFYPKFGTGVQGIVTLEPSAGIGSIALDPSAPTEGYNVNDMLQLVQPGAAGGVAIVTEVGPDGEILGLAIAQAGVGFQVQNSVPTTGGSGTGAAINILTVDSLGGAGYVVGDTFGVIQLGGAGATAQVDAVDSNGGVTAASVVVPGQGYSPVPGLLTQGGTGSGLQIDILSISPFNTRPPQIVIQTFITLASACLQSARWLDQWNYAMALFTAHYSTLYLQSEGSVGAQSTAGQIAQSGLKTGVTISKAAGDVSISKQQIVEDHLAQFSSFLLTSYGQQLAQMASAVGAGMMYIY